MSLLPKELSYLKKSLLTEMLLSSTCNEDLWKMTQFSSSAGPRIAAATDAVDTLLTRIESWKRALGRSEFGASLKSPNFQELLKVTMTMMIRNEVP
jgi:hypothetical protein